MSPTRTRRPARPAFTLIELLVVIAIIAVLIALTTAGVQKVRAVATRVRAANDITELQDSLRVAMKAYHDAPVLPSRLVLFNNLNRYTTNPPTGETAADTALRKRSADTLRRMFGQRLLTNGTSVPWDGTTNDSKTVLEGQQCLVFYLGGAQTTNSSGARGCLGFSASPLNPLDFTATKDKLGPYFQFKSTRLVPGNSNGNAFGTNGFFVYLDPYRDPTDSLAKPFAYFSSTTAANTYSPYGSSDCPSLGLSPYQDSTGTFLNSNSFQIISAGADALFGPGGAAAYDPATGAKDVSTGDNQANFSKSLLAAPQS